MPVYYQTPLRGLRGFSIDEAAEDYRRRHAERRANGEDFLDLEEAPAWPDDPQAAPPALPAPAPAAPMPFPPPLSATPEEISASFRAAHPDADKPFQPIAYANEKAPGLSQQDMTGVLYNENAQFFNDPNLDRRKLDNANLAAGYVMMNRQAAGTPERFGPQPGGKAPTLASTTIAGQEMKAVQGGYRPAVEAYDSASKAADFLFNAPGAFPPPNNYQMFNHREDSANGAWKGDPQHPLMLQYGPFNNPTKYRYINIYK